MRDQSAVRGTNSQHQFPSTTLNTKTLHSQQGDLRGVLYPVLVLQDGLDVGVGDDHVVQLQLRWLTLGLHGSNQIHCGSVKRSRKRGGSKDGFPTTSSSDSLSVIVFDLLQPTA